NEKNQEPSSWLRTKSQDPRTTGNPKYEIQKLRCRTRAVELRASYFEFTWLLVLGSWFFAYSRDVAQAQVGADGVQRLSQMLLGEEHHVDGFDAETQACRIGRCFGSRGDVACVGAVHPINQFGELAAIRL